MQLEEEERTKISNVKEEERKKASNEIELFKKSQCETKESSLTQEKNADYKMTIAKNEEKDIFKMEEFNKALSNPQSTPKSTLFALAFFVGAFLLYLEFKIQKLKKKFHFLDLREAYKLNLRLGFSQLLRESLKKRKKKK